MRGMTFWAKIARLYGKGLDGVKVVSGSCGKNHSVVGPGIYCSPHHQHASEPSNIGIP